MINYNLNTSAQSLGGGINEIEDRIDFIEFTDIPWNTVGTYPCPGGTYQRISNDVQNDRIIRITGDYNILVLRDGTIGINQYAIRYCIDGQSFTAIFSSGDTVEILSNAAGVGKVDPNSDGTGEIFNHYSGSRHNEATGNYAHAEGKYNYDDSSAIHMVGVGISSSNRKNAIVVHNDGAVYINGIGGYSGTTTSGAQSLQEVIASLLTQ